MKMLIRKVKQSVDVTVTDGNTTIELELLTKDDAAVLRQELYNCVDYLDECIRYGEVWESELTRAVIAADREKNK